MFSLLLKDLISDFYFTDCDIFSAPLFAFYCFKCYLASFSRYKTVFLSNIMPPTHTDQDQIDTRWLGKRLVFWRASRRVDRSLIIVNKSIKETKKYYFFQCKIEFYFTHEHLNLYFYWKYCIWCSFGEIKFDLTLKKSNILYIFSFSGRAVVRTCSPATLSKEGH